MRLGFPRGRAVSAFYLSEMASGAPRPGRSTAVRSPAGERARRRGGRRRRRGSLLALAVVARRSVLLRGGKREKRATKIESGEGQMALGFKGAAAVAGFVPAMRSDGRRIGANGRDQMGQLAAQAGARTRKLCRPRPRLRPGCGLRVRAVMGRADFAGFWAVCAAMGQNGRTQ